MGTTTLTPGAIYTADVPAAPTPSQISTGGLLTTPATTTATTGTATTYTPTDWNVDSKQTVQGQVADIIAKGSPLQQQAEARSNMRMNQRGLLNSSMAIGAGQSALYDAALPIAQADAQTNAQSAQFNAGAKNTAAQYNTGATNQQNLTNQADQNRASEFNASAQNTVNSQLNTIEANARTGNANSANQLALANLDNQFKTAIANADAGNKMQLQSMSDNAKTLLTNIEADYKTLIQTSASASEIYKGTLGQIGSILTDTNMDAAAKSAAINGLFTRMSTAMNLIGSINGVDLTDLLDFGTVTPA